MLLHFIVPFINPIDLSKNFPAIPIWRKIIESTRSSATTFCFQKHSKGWKHQSVCRGDVKLTKKRKPMPWGSTFLHTYHLHLAVLTRGFSHHRCVGVAPPVRIHVAKEQLARPRSELQFDASQPVRLLTDDNCCQNHKCRFNTSAKVRKLHQYSLFSFVYLHFLCAPVCTFASQLQKCAGMIILGTRST